MNVANNPLWHPVLMDPSSSREKKPRTIGLTMMIDQGIGPRQFEETLACVAPYVDFIKLGYGTSALYPVHLLKQKVALARAAGVVLYPGGTFFEIAIQHGVIHEYVAALEEAGFDCLELSDGTITLPHEQRRRLIKECTAKGFTVLTECGKKESGSQLTLRELEKTLYEDLECGASYVIVEGRESGTDVGIYDKNGEPDYNFLCAMQTSITPAIHERLIWEAPKKKQQIDFIQFFGRNVNVGNIQPHEIYSLECLRRGLRSDTFAMSPLYTASSPIL